MRILAILLSAPLLFGACSLLVDFEEEKTSQERNCHDNLDNDDDGRTDCDDQDCDESEDCTGPNVNNLNNVVNQEFCANGEDDDDDGMVDCEDEECWSDPNCDTIRETDCGNHADDDDNGYIDCDDPDCNESPICTQGLQLCNEIFNYNVAQIDVYYYHDLYDLANLPCPEDTFCTIIQEFSSLPYCYRLPADEFATPYSPCGPGQPCGPGMMCGFSDLLSPDQGEVCLPWCAPGFHPECIGGEGICFNRWSTSYDDVVNQIIELWTCDIPQCNPMQPTQSGCDIGTAGCYPDPSLFGAAACHDIGTIAESFPCPSGDDLSCMPGNVCRKSPAEQSKTCHALCTVPTTCTSSTCIKDDPRQHFGYCK